MKRMLKSSFLAISVALFSVVFCAEAGTAYNGDLIIGFTAGSGSDLVYDLGSAATLTDGHSWDLSSLLGGYTLSSVHWGIIGNTLNGIGGGADNSVYTTTANSSTTPKPLNQSGYNAVNGQVKNIYGLFPAAGAGQHATIASSFANSWFAQTLSPTLPTQYKNAYEDPNVTGLVSDVLWGVDTQGGPTVQLGTLTLGPSGSVTFAAVPEPAPCVLMVLASLLMLFLRRKVRLPA